MMEYIGTKRIKAKPMSRQEYINYRDWELPRDEDGSDTGFLVEYIDGGGPNHANHDGYISWSPSEVFEKAYQSTGNMNFGHALEILKGGACVAREGWNGKGMFLYLVPANAYPAQTGAAKAYWGADAKVPYGAYIAMKTAQDNVVPWLASQTDVLADDWSVVIPDRNQV